MNCIALPVPHLNITLYPKMKIQLGRFNSERWIVEYGWYCFGGNREVCGWYLVNDADRSCIKPLQRPDLDDIYVIER